MTKRIAEPSLRDLLAPLLLSDGWTYQEVGDLFGVTRQRMQKLYKLTRAKKTIAEFLSPKKHQYDINLRDKSAFLLQWMSKSELAKLTGLHTRYFASLGPKHHRGRMVTVDGVRRKACREAKKFILAAAWIDGASVLDLSELGGMTPAYALLYVHRNRNLFPRRVGGGTKWEWGAPVGGNA